MCVCVYTVILCIYLQAGNGRQAGQVQIQIPDSGMQGNRGLTAGYEQHSNFNKLTEEQRILAGICRVVTLHIPAKILCEGMRCR